MALYELARTQRLPISLDEAWEYFSSPKNLKEITPARMNFRITTDERDLETMYDGQIIGYTVEPILGIPLEWVTEIKHVRKGRFFVDEQRFGPYAFWHHKHFFEAISGGCEMRDVVHYRLPLGPIGRLGHWIFVRKQLETIFDFRFAALEKRFGKMG